MKADALPSPSDDAWIETILRDRPSDYIDDAGFSARVVQMLPRRNHRRPWLLAGAVGLGCAIAAPIAGPAMVDDVVRLPDRVSSSIQFDPVVAAYVFLGAGLLVAAGTTWRALVRHR